MQQKTNNEKTGLVASRERVSAEEYFAPPKPVERRKYHTVTYQSATGKGLDDVPVSERCLVTYSCLRQKEQMSDDQWLSFLEDVREKFSSLEIVVVGKLGAISERDRIVIEEGTNPKDVDFSALAKNWQREEEDYKKHLVGICEKHLNDNIPWKVVTWTERTNSWKHALARGWIYENYHKKGDPLFKQAFSSVTDYLSRNGWLKRYKQNGGFNRENILKDTNSCEYVLEEGADWLVRVRESRDLHSETSKTTFVLYTGDLNALLKYITQHQVGEDRSLRFVKIKLARYQANKEGRYLGKIHGEGRDSFPSIAGSGNLLFVSGSGRLLCRSPLSREDPVGVFREVNMHFNSGVSLAAGFFANVSKTSGEETGFTIDLMCQTLKHQANLLSKMLEYAENFKNGKASERMSDGFCIEDSSGLPPKVTGLPTNLTSGAPTFD